MTAFQQVFEDTPTTSGTAPGRVNLLGEHTDYNDGFVLPTPIPQQTTVDIGPAPDERHHFHSLNLDTLVSCHRNAESAPGFAQYLLGCIRVLEEIAGPIPPLRCAVASTVPLGAGLSSSAALEVAALRALCRFLDVSIDGVTLAHLAQKAEIRFAGVRCGIMDQMAASLGRPEHLLFLDTRSLEYRHIPLPTKTEILVIDSGVPRTLAASAYNRRRAQCEMAAALLHIPALRDADIRAVHSLPEPLRRRARHVITENLRVLEAARGISGTQFGALMNASHASLRDDFQVSSPGLDALVSSLQNTPGVLGARLTGAGFGGACVALVHAGKAIDIARTALSAYQHTGGAGRRLVPP